MVIPCLHGADQTRECIRSLRAQAGDHELEILLVGTAAAAASAALSQPDPRVQVLPQAREPGFAGACNEGLRRAAHPFVLVLDNGTRAAAHMLTRLGQALERDERIAFAAPVSNDANGPGHLRVGDHGASAEGLARIEREFCDPRAAWIEDVDTLPGLCLLGRATTWARLRGFDARCAADDSAADDLCLRTRLLGLRLVIARGAYLHHEAHRPQAPGPEVTPQVHRLDQALAARWQADPAGRAAIAALAGDLAGAARAAEEARREHPHWPDADWHVGRWLAHDGQHEQAIPRLQAFVRHAPAHAQALLCLCRCHLALGRFTQVPAILRHHVGTQTLDPIAASALLQDLGDDARGRSDVDAAVGCFAEALAWTPDDAALQNRLGAAYVEQRRFDLALPLLERAAATGLSLAHTNLGICHFHGGDPARALEHFAAAARQLPDDPTAQLDYARARAASTGAPRPAD